MQILHERCKALCGGRERIGRQSARAAGLGPVIALKIDAHAFAADLNERMRHGAAFALAHVQPVAFGDDPAENADVKFFGNDKVVDRNDKMIQRFCDGH